MQKSPGENISSFEKKEQTPLSEQEKNFLDTAIQTLKNNNEKREEVEKNFQSQINEILQNPDNFKKILEMIDANMREKIHNISEQVKKGEIYSEEGKEQAKNIIIEATKTKLQALMYHQNIKISWQ